MVTVSVYNSRGTIGRRIQLDFAKSALARKIETAISEGRATTRDLEKLDAGTLGLGRLLALGISPDAIRKALDSAITKSLEAAQVHADVSTLLAEWTIAQGGEAAAPASPVATIQTKEPPSKPTTSGTPLTKAATEIVRKAEQRYREVKKSETSAELLRHGWRHENGAEGFEQCTHDLWPGHSVTVRDEDGSWKHHRYTNEVARSQDGDGPEDHRASLKTHLHEFHHHDRTGFPSLDQRR